MKRSANSEIAPAEHLESSKVKVKKQLPRDIEHEPDVIALGRLNKYCLTDCLNNRRSKLLLVDLASFVDFDNSQADFNLIIANYEAQLQQNPELKVVLFTSEFTSKDIFDDEDNYTPFFASIIKPLSNITACEDVLTLAEERNKHLFAMLLGENNPEVFYAYINGAFACEAEKQAFETETRYKAVELKNHIDTATEMELTETLTADTEEDFGNETFVFTETASREPLDPSILEDIVDREEKIAQFNQHASFFAIEPEKDLSVAFKALDLATTVRKQF